MKDQQMEDQPVEDQPDWAATIARLLHRPQELRVVYQPIIDLRTGDALGYKALTRLAEWPARSPEPWFLAASRLGMAPQLEAATLMTALRRRRELPQGHFLAVILATSVLGHPAVTEVLLDQGDLSGLVGEVDNPGQLRRDQAPLAALAALRARGLLVAVEVTDAGFTELESVGRTRPDLIKLDRRLVTGIHADPVRQAVVRLVVDVAGTLGVAVLAEGVESRDDALLLQHSGVRMAQGWLFGRARPGFVPPSAQAVSWMRACWEQAG